MQLTSFFSTLFLLSLFCFNLLLWRLRIEIHFVLLQKVLQLLDVKVTQIEETVSRMVGMKTFSRTGVELSTLLYTYIHIYTFYKEEVTIDILFDATIME